MAKPNYQFEKRQRDLAKKRKQEEKRRNKLADKAAAGDVADTADSPATPEAGDAAVERPEGAATETPSPKMPE